MGKVCIKSWKERLLLCLQKEMYVGRQMSSSDVIGVGVVWGWAEKSGCVESERDELISPLSFTSRLCLRLQATLTTTSITNLNLRTDGTVYARFWQGRRLCGLNKMTSLILWHQFLNFFKQWSPLFMPAGLLCFICNALFLLMWKRGRTT